jgi:hypothetical protein
VLVGVCMCVDVYMYVCRGVDVYVEVYVCRCVCMYVCICVNMDIVYVRTCCDRHTELLDLIIELRKLGLQYRIENPHNLRIHGECEIHQSKPRLRAGADLVTASSYWCIGVVSVYMKYNCVYYWDTYVYYYDI